jgi:hypothetical protein
VIRGSRVEVAKRESAVRELSSKPVVFVQNDGQWSDDVQFGARGGGVAAAFTARGITLSARARDEDGKEYWQAVELQFAGADRPARWSGETKLPGVHNYLIGNDPSKHRINVPLYEGLLCDSAAPGISMVATHREGRLAYDLHVEPGADLSAAEITCKGADAVSVDPDGGLTIETPAGILRQSAPKSWYELPAGKTRLADCRFKSIGPITYGFEVQDRDSTSKLIVDPGLVWSTYLGGSEADEINDVDFVNGKVTVTGWTRSTETTFPSMAGRFDPTQNGLDDAFVTRFDPALSDSAQLVWTTFLGGSDNERAFGLDVASNGKVAVCGRTSSPNFPVTSNAHSTSQLFGNDVFVAYLNASGVSLLYGSYYGGTGGQTVANAVAVDSAGIITIVGATQARSPGFLPNVNAYDPNYDAPPPPAVTWDAFAARFDTNLSSSTLTYSTYIGGNLTATEDDEAHAVKLFGGWIYIGGFTKSNGFHVANSVPGGPGVPYDPFWNLGRDGFLMILDPTVPPASQLLYATFLGSAGDEEVWDILIDMGVFLACGRTSSGAPTPFPVTTGALGEENAAYSSTLMGIDDVFISKLDPTLTPQLVYSTYLGGNQADWGLGIAQGGHGMTAVVTGWTSSNNFPMAGGTDPNGPYDASYNGNRDVFLTRLNWGAGRAPAAQLDYSTYLGDTNGDEAHALARSGNDCFISGMTASTNFPTAGNPFDPSWNGGLSDGWVANLQLPLLPFP